MLGKVKMKSFIMHKKHTQWLDIKAVKARGINKSSSINITFSILDFGKIVRKSTLN